MTADDAKRAEEAKAADAKKLADKKAAAKKKEPVEPARHWVQIAGGANKGSLPREYKRLQDKAPKLAGVTAKAVVGQFIVSIADTGPGSRSPSSSR